MDPETIDKVKEALEPLAEKLGEGATYSWEVLVRQMVLHGVVFVALGAVALAVCAYAFFRARRHHAKWQELSDKLTTNSEHRLYMNVRDEKETQGILATVFGVGSGVTLLLAGIFLSSGLLRLLNPAYYAIRELANVAGIS